MVSRVADRGWFLKKLRSSRLERRQNLDSFTLDMQCRVRYSRVRLSGGHGKGGGSEDRALDFWA